MAGPTVTHLKPDRISRDEVTSSGAKVYLCTPHRVRSAPPLSDSPPTRDPGPGPHRGLQRKDERSTLEVRRLQKELQSYVQNMKELARKGKSEEILDPDEELRARIWRQEQAVRSARMLYVLQQQVKEIQEDLEKLSPQKIKHTKKSQAMARLAAAERGAVRALQGFVTHLANPAKQQSASAQCRELGNLIRQLSLCSARLEADASIPDVVIDLLLQIEDLETLLSQKGKKRPISASQVEPTAGSTRLPRREKKVRVPEPQKPVVVRRLLPDEFDVSDENLAPRNRFIPHSTAAAPDSLLTTEQETAGYIRQQVLGRSRPRKMEPGHGSGHPKKRGVLVSRPQDSCRPSGTKATSLAAKPAHFQESTVAFRLKETKPALQESRSPGRAPRHSSPFTSPHRFPGKQASRGPQRREPIQKSKRTAEAGPTGLGSDPARAEGTFPAQIAEEVENAVRARLEPLLANAQRVNLSLERTIGLKESLWENQPSPSQVGKAVAVSLPGTSLEGPALEQGKRSKQESFLPDLEAMLRRVEEIECSQEAVRRRYNQIVYSDPEFWAQALRKEAEDAARGQEPQAPGPIQVTKPNSHKEPQVDIVLEKPLDANAAEKDLETEEWLDPGSQTLQTSTSWAPRKEGGTFLSVPLNMLQSISTYRAQYEQHLQRLSHEEVGSFNPWHVAQSLAEELAEEVVGNVATELQALCEDYAEAVFTSEFLQVAE